MSENKTLNCVVDSTCSGELQRPQLTWGNFVLDLYIICTPKLDHRNTYLLSLLFMYSAKKSRNSPKCCLNATKSIAFNTEHVTEIYRMLLILLYYVTF